MLGVDLLPRGNLFWPAPLQPPRRCEAIWERPVSGQRQLDAPPYLRLGLGLGREQNPNPQLVTYPVRLHMVRRERTGRLVLPVPAQGDRDRRPRSPLVCSWLQDEDR